MISVDTNIVVRLLTKDDQPQYQISFKLFQEQEIFIGDTVILETEWVLRFAYKFSASDIYQAFIKLFGLANVHLTNANKVAQVLEWYHSGLDFADAFHLAHSQRCTQMYTFDRKFSRKADNLTECEVIQPKSD